MLIDHVRYEHDRAVYRSIPETSGIFSTFPSPHLSILGGIFDQFLGTFLLLVCICAVTDKRNMKIEKQLIPLSIGFTVLGLWLRGQPCQGLGSKTFLR